MFEPLAESEITELNYSRTPLGDSSRSCCKVTTGNVCGSGSLVGVRDGKSLVLTNAHVAGSRPGKQVTCMFPFADNARVNARIIMAGYSDKVMMDWAVLECDRMVGLPHIKLCNELPDGEHYTGGYPRCQGPLFQRLSTQRITHNGTVWRWQPNSIGGQSGSAVHSFRNHLQFGLLTWSWGGDGAGQTCRSIWWQYVSRSAVGFERPEGLIELNENRAEDLENGFFQESNITTLPIWAHLDGGGDGGDGGGGDGGDSDKDGCPSLAAKVMAEAEELQRRAANLVELARSHGAGNGDGGGDTDPPLFGLG